MVGAICTGGLGAGGGGGDMNGGIASCGKPGKGGTVCDEDIRHGVDQGIDVPISVRMRTWLGQLRTFTISLLLAILVCTRIP